MAFERDGNGHEAPRRSVRCLHVNPGPATDVGLPAIGVAMDQAERPALLERPPDLTTVLAMLEVEAQHIDAAEVPALVARLGAVLGVAGARLVSREPQPPRDTAVAPYTLAEAAALLRKSPAWLRRQAVAGRIPCARKVGRSWVFPRTDFDRLRQRRSLG
jgi:hypothetical protein